MTEPTDAELEDADDCRLNRLIENYEAATSWKATGITGNDDRAYVTVEPDITFEAARPAVNDEGVTVFWVTGDEPFPAPWIEHDPDLVVNGWADDTPK